MGLRAWKVVATLSRYPIDNPIYHPVRVDGDETDYGILQVTAVIDGLVHQIFSLRFDAHDARANREGHRLATQISHLQDPGHAIIMGGDFNNGGDRLVGFEEFVAQSALRNAYQGPVTRDWPVDHIFYRGPYTAIDTEVTEPPPDTSDHGYIYTGLSTMTSDPGFETVYDGNGIGDYDLADVRDRAFAFDYSSSGNLDHIAVYRPGERIFWVLRNNAGAFSPVFISGEGIGGPSG